MIEIHEIDVKTPEGRKAWLDLRKQDVTASDVAAVCGRHPSRTPLMVYCEKTGRTAPEPENALMRGGRWLEAAALEALKERRPDWHISPATVYVRDAALRIGATPDAYAVDADGRVGCIELKVVAAPEFDAKWCSEDAVFAPMHHILQVLTAMHLHNYSWGAVVALIIDAYRRDLEIINVLAHPAAWDAVKRHVAAFWEKVEAGTPPPAIGNLDAETVAALHPSVNQPLRDMSGDNYLLDLLAEHERARAEIEKIEQDLKPWTAHLTALRTKIREKIGDAEGATAGPYIVTLKEQTRKAIPATKFRVLRIKKAGEP